MRSTLSQNDADSTVAPQQCPPTNCSRVNELTTQKRSDLRNMFPCEFPVTPSMRLIGDRLNSFIKWSFTQAAPHVLAEAGFFSLGVRDRVKCFYCNGGLQNWRQDDNPWEEHAKWYPTCKFLLQQRGPEYIHTIVARFPNINRPILHAPGQDMPTTQQVQNGKETFPVAPASEIEVVASSPSQTAAHTALEVAMKSEVVSTIIGLGFDQLLIRDVTHAKIEEYGTGYQSAVELLQAVEETQRLREKSSVSMVSFDYQKHKSFESTQPQAEIADRREAPVSMKYSICGATKYPRKSHSPNEQERSIYIRVTEDVEPLKLIAVPIPVVDGRQGGVEANHVEGNYRPSPHLRPTPVVPISDMEEAASGDFHLRLDDQTLRNDLPGAAHASPSVERRSLDTVPRLEETFTFQQRLGRWRHIVYLVLAELPQPEVCVRCSGCVTCLHARHYCRCTPNGNNRR